MRNKYKDGLNIGLEDKRTEVYVPPPPPKYIEFSGQGVSLSNTKPGSEETKPLGNINLNLEPPKVDESKPKTTIQIRLYNGKTVQLTLNISDKVFKIFDYVQRFVLKKNREKYNLKFF